MEMFEIVKEAINSLGFPIAMVGYFIWDKNKSMMPLIESVNTMNTLLQVLINKFDIPEETIRNE